MCKTKDEEVKGIRKISTFVTAAALLAAVLLVWAQLWIQPSVRLWAASYFNSENVAEILEAFNLNTGLGLIWTYIAVLLALLALTWVGYCTLKTSTDKAPALAVALFTASLTMAIIDVSQSIIFTFLKLFVFHFSFYKPLSLPSWLLWSLVTVAVGIVAFFGSRAYKMSRD